MTDLDSGSFCNDGGAEDGNMAWNSDSDLYRPVPLTDATRKDTVKSHPLVALKDIKEGEQLLCRYGQFSEGNW
eukprot:CAMPEP_0198141608 /NCGR_PEP_ID=MMETSP1443-20131203/4597_1 /TAXON_ID=186043 /ORGANISM="Entomoneis sp., Strain CCMP2396" /LENGTH=72 /DNA_ID=CAMNT_0043804409 /DNA_START=143 /DNA_END=358 /DNA_ORIENTATION=-